MIVPDSTQVPLYEPIYSNGVISQVWVMFFQKLAKLANNTDANGDILELIQLANQLSTNAHLAQQGLDIAEMQNVFTTVPIHLNHIEEIPPLQAVFLCDQKIMPLCAIPMSIEPVLPMVTLPSSEIIHD